MKTNFEIVKSQFNPSHWKSIDDYEVFYLKYIKVKLIIWNFDGIRLFTSARSRDLAMT